MLLTFSADGHYLYVSLTMENRVAVLRVTDINNPVRVDDPNSNQPFGGPHYITLTPDGSHLVVSDYFLQEGTEGVVNPPADYMVWVVPIFRNGPNVGGLDVAHARSIDFKTRFTSGVAHPHGVKVVYEPTPDACLREGHH
jgi:DNA-binding beta-propeller fold protein YncE